MNINVPGEDLLSGKSQADAEGSQQRAADAAAAVAIEILTRLQTLRTASSSAAAPKIASTVPTRFVLDSVDSRAQ
jgi:hypothetical protein